MKTRYSNGFTILELIMIIALIGSIAVIMFMRSKAESDRAIDAANEAKKHAINSQIELYYFEHHTYPTAMTPEGWGGTDIAKYYWPEGVPSQDAFGEAWIIDTENHCIADPE